MPDASEDPRLSYLNGLKLLKAGQASRAARVLRDVLAHDPSHLGARRNLIRALIVTGAWADVIAETGHTTGAERLYHLGDAELLYHLGTALSMATRWDEAREALTQAITLDPTHAGAWLNLGNVLVDLDELEAGGAHCRRATELAPGMVEAHVSLGFALTSLGLLTEGIAALEQAVRLAPEDARAHWNLATALLLAGDLPRGFAAYEWRKQHDRFRADFINLPGPIWDGGALNGRVVMVHAEQGFGDTIQFARYLKLIVQRGGRPILACDPCLVSVLSGIPDAVVVSKSGSLPRYDVWIDQMSLPHVFGTTLATIPSAKRYLQTPDPASSHCHPLDLPDRHPRACPEDRNRHCAATDGRDEPCHDMEETRTTPVRGPNDLRGAIGLVWRGNPLHSNDRRRTPPASAFTPLLEMSGRQFVSLIPGAALPGMAPSPVDLRDFAATASIIAALDLVITVDSAVAHLAGAMGRPTWVLLPFAPDWRWLLHRSDTPWYESIRLFRQPAPGDWASIIAAVTAALAG